MSRAHWFFISLILFMGLAAMPVVAFIGAGLSKNMPSHGTPQKLVEAWLRFHETDLCQDVDAVFIFHNYGMEVWFVYAHEESFLKMQELFKPLQDSYRIEFYPTRQPEEKKSDDEEGPPPSLYMNNELLERIRNLDLKSFDWRALSPSEEARHKTQMALSTGRDYMLESRLLIFARQILNWNRKARRYAMDLPLLTGAALDATAAPKVSAQAVKACTAHARNLEKNIGKLKANLKQAFPRQAEKKNTAKPEKPEKPDKAARNLIESAQEISETAQSIAQRIYHFLYPEHHTVNASELRQPGLPDDLGSFEAKILDFQKELSSLPQIKDLASSKSGRRVAR
jgi:hypothetical protein